MLSTLSSTARTILRKVATSSSFRQQQIPAVRSFATGGVTELNDSLESVQTFQTSHPKAILYYTATWCGPCRHIKPTYQALAEKHAGEIAFGLVDIDANADAAAEVRISSVPTFMSFAQNKPVQQFSGADPNQLNQMVEALEQMKAEE